MAGPTSMTVGPWRRSRRDRLSRAVGFALADEELLLIQVASLRPKFVPTEQSTDNSATRPGARLVTAWRADDVGMAR
jgi:hypothetical protein